MRWIRIFGKNCCLCHIPLGGVKWLVASMVVLAATIQLNAYLILKTVFILGESHVSYNLPNPYFHELRVDVYNNPGSILIATVQLTICRVEFTPAFHNAMFVVIMSIGNRSIMCTLARATGERNSR